MILRTTGEKIQTLASGFPAVVVTGPCLYNTSNVEKQPIK